MDSTQDTIQPGTAQFWNQQTSLQQEAVKLTHACSDLAITSQEHEQELAELSQLLDRIKGAVGSKARLPFGGDGTVSEVRSHWAG